jgi:hypothetical protein
VVVYETEWKFGPAAAEAAEDMSAAVVVAVAVVGDVEAGAVPTFVSRKTSSR